MSSFPYRRVLVIGSPGSGKSTFARGLHRATGLPLVHLDMLYWRADRTALEKEAFYARLEKELACDCWIIDGNYPSTMEWRLQRAELVVFLDLPAEKCLNGIEKRRNQPRTDMPWIETKEDKDLTALVQRFPAEGRVRICELLAKHPHVPVVRLCSHAEADAYWKMWEA